MSFTPDKEEICIILRLLTIVLGTQNNKDNLLWLTGLPSAGVKKFKFSCNPLKRICEVSPCPPIAFNILNYRFELNQL